MHSLKKTAINIAKAWTPRMLVIQKLPVNGNKRILLTFDDGPDPKTTPLILDSLDKHGAKAIFFIPGSRIERAPELVVEVIARGHFVGNHTFAHEKDLKPNLLEYRRDIIAGQVAIKNVCGVTPKYFRPPMGVITPSVILAAKSLGLKILRWSIEAGEYNVMKNRSPEEISERLLRNVVDGDIVLLHDNFAKMPEIIERTLPQLRAAGFDLGEAALQL
jgi:peptidoglycan/xylan/chitin deacetylase (PgdA/CDA1 family)